MFQNSTNNLFNFRNLEDEDTWNFLNWITYDWHFISSTSFIWNYWVVFTSIEMRQWRNQISLKILKISLIMYSFIKQVRFKQFVHKYSLYMGTTYNLASIADFLQANIYKFVSSSKPKIAVESICHCVRPVNVGRIPFFDLYLLLSQVYVKILLPFLYNEWTDYFSFCLDI